MHEVVLQAYQLPLLNEVGYLEDENGEFIHPKRLLEDLHVFIFVESGTIEVVEEHIHYVLKAGDYLFLHKGIKHWGTTRYQPHTRWYYIHFFTPDPIIKPHDEYQSSIAPSIIPKELYDKQITLSKSGHVEQIIDMMTRLNQVIKKQDEGPLAQSVESYQMFLFLYNQAKKARRKPRHQQIVDDIIDLLQKKQQKCSSQEIANSIHLDYAYISTIFKKVTGKTIRQFQNEVMIERAITTFTYSNANITEVSDQLGFPNPYYFSRVFKQVTGISPSQYIKQRYQQ